jgi:hypothetical protein
MFPVVGADGLAWQRARTRHAGCDLRLQCGDKLIVRQRRSGGSLMVLLRTVRWSELEA